MFDAAKAKYKDIKFITINTENQKLKYLVEKYNVQGIPRLVLLGEKNKVLYNGAAQQDLEGLIKHFHD